MLQSGAFVVEGVLGQGGFGITYKCREARLNRTVALKECFPHAQGCFRRGTTVHPGGGMSINEFNEERIKFLEEGQCLAQFQHGSIVKILSVFEENNTAYMVMEFLEGKTLVEMVDEIGLPGEQWVVRLVERLASALEVVHQKNVLHRDVKPENIIITPYKRVVLIDFGTAREFAVGKTRRMTTALTPGYAPLEQYGQHARFGPFTDTYALGATAYFLLTGQVPTLATDRAAGVALPAPRRLGRGISSQVSDAVMWAMEMRVDKRPQSASEFAEAMRGIRPVPSIGSTKPSSFTHSRTFIAVGLCILGVTACVALFMSERQEAHQVLRRGVEKVPPSKQPAPRPSRSQPEARVLESLKPSDYLALGHKWLEDGNYDYAISNYDRFIQLEPRNPRGFYGRGLAWYYKGDYDVAIDAFDSALTIAPGYSEAYYSRGRAWNGKRAYDRAIDDYDRAIKINPRYTEAYDGRGPAKCNQTDYSGAIADFSMALQVDPQYADAYRWRAFAYRQIGDATAAYYDEAAWRRLTSGQP